MGDVRIKPWSIEYSGPVTDYTQSIFTIGNGYIGVRGFSTQEKKKTPCCHAIFRAGLYEQVKPGITDLVQLPDVLHFPVGQGDVTEQSLNLQDGVLTQSWQNVRCERMASMADPQLLCVRWTIDGGDAIPAEILAMYKEPQITEKGEINRE